MSWPNFNGWISFLRNTFARPIRHEEIINRIRCNNRSFICRDTIVIITDHNFAEPGLFVINSDGRLQVVDLSNNPFARPDLEVFVSGLEWIRKPENNYPIRGTFA